ncbi:unnamed protein product, partial [Discosporangium mesarthrocarpum]
MEGDLLESVLPVSSVGLEPVLTTAKVEGQAGNEGHLDPLGGVDAGAKDVDVKDAKGPGKEEGGGVGGGGAEGGGRGGGLKEPTGPDTVDAGWLYSKSVQYHREQGAVGLPPVDMALSIMEAINKSADPGALQALLFDLLGEAGLELMMEIMEKAEKLRGSADARDILAIADAHAGGGMPTGGV